jgi:alpha-L-fucosidase
MFTLTCRLLLLAAFLALTCAGARASTDLGWFTEARFGMFIHWGPVSLRGTEIGWSRGAQVPADEYDQLYASFDPARFDADAWVATAKAAGMKYIVITAKHHDGFCLWDSKLTDYDIMATPFGRDVLAELAEACARHDIRFCTYYSICDWHHPDYPTGSPGGRGRKTDADMDRYVTYMKGQLEELITDYGPLGVIWFDGEWEEPWTVERGDDLYRFVKEVQPDVIVNNRVNKARHGMAGTTRQDIANPGDYDTPEQRIGGFSRERPWETCMTICRQWAWKPDDQMKSLEECLRTLIHVVGSDGNLLFNVGPMPDGRIEPRQVQRLEEMGRWLERYGEGIYGTRGGPFKPGWWGASTCRDDAVYLFITDWSDERGLVLPPLDAAIRSVTALTGGAATVEERERSLRVQVDEEHRDAIATIVKVQLDRPSFELEPTGVPRPPSGSVAFNAEASASNTFRKVPDYAPGMAFDDDPDTRWATDAGTSDAWIEVDLGSVKTISRAVIVEGDWDRVRRYELQVERDDAWVTIVRGDRLGERADLRFDPVETQRVRLHILEAVEGPTIWEIQLF